ncbi:hypothetical protein FB006_103265 [Sinorhizobium medicae]|nr:hypothetical protein FB006_103265 [Sinorhizobium medicae]
MAVAPRLLHPALEAVTGRREGERHFRRQIADGALSSRLTEAEAADDDGDPRSARAGPGTRILLHRSQAVRADDRQPAFGTILQQAFIRKRCHARVLAARRPDIDKGGTAGFAWTGRVFPDRRTVVGQNLLDIGAGESAAALQRRGGCYGRAGGRCLGNRVRFGHGRCCRGARQGNGKKGAPRRKPHDGDGCKTEARIAQEATKIALMRASLLAVLSKGGVEISCQTGPRQSFDPGLISRPA